MKGPVGLILRAVFGAPRQRSSSLTSKPHVRKEREPVGIQHLEQLRLKAAKKGTR